MERDASEANSTSERLEPSSPLFWLVEEDPKMGTCSSVIVLVLGGSTTQMKSLVGSIPKFAFLAIFDNYKFGIHLVGIKKK